MRFALLLTATFLAACGTMPRVFAGDPLGGDPQAWMAMGNLAYGDADYDKAEHCFKRALKLAPHHVGASNNLAMTYLAKGGPLHKAKALAQDALAQGGPLKPYVLDTLALIQEREAAR